MGRLSSLEPEAVFQYFEEICSIPHGSGNMEEISQYCLDFASAHNLRAVRDAANNIVIYKDATAGYEACAPVILQGHLDMVCQKTEDCDIDFEKDGIRPYVDGDFVKAEGTTLGADNGIAVAMTLAILASNDIAHPPLEALFTTDEETGMCGALALDGALFKGRKLINMDAEEPGCVTVSCAGGSDFQMTLPIHKKTVQATKVTIRISGLAGGHSGIEIHKGRVNADLLMGRVLHAADQIDTYAIIDVNGGDKGNAIPLAAVANIAVEENAAAFAEKLAGILDEIKKEISDREPQASLTVQVEETGAFSVWGADAKQKLLSLLLCAPNGVMDMSVDIEGLVETSLNLGVLKTEDSAVQLLFTLRSCKKSALKFLETRLQMLTKSLGFSAETGGHYPPWEYKADSQLRELYLSCHRTLCGTEARVEAIHAGLECGVLSSKIEGLDCIAIGPALYDVHTVGERLSISSVAQTYALVQQILKECK